MLMNMVLSYKATLITFTTLTFSRDQNDNEVHDDNDNVDEEYDD